MKVKTKEVVVNQVENYLNTASKHLFVTASGHLYKVLPLTKDGKLYTLTIMLGKDQVLLNISESVTDSMYNWYGNSTANIIKRSLFPEYYKTKSIPNFKKMRILVNEIVSEIKYDNNSNKALIDKLKAKMPELEVSK